MAVALITGTSTGIGLATARLFAQRGYRVLAGARTPASSEGLAAAIAEGLPIVPVPLDVDSDASVQVAMRDIGAVDVLVNNAGIGSAAPIEHVPIAELRALFETNVFGAVRMMQAVLPSMRARRTGVVINVTSMMGRITLPGHGSYAATKFALGAMTESLAMEVRPHGIRVALDRAGRHPHADLGQARHPAARGPRVRRGDVTPDAHLRIPVRGRHAVGGRGRGDLGRGHPVGDAIARAGGPGRGGPGRVAQTP